MNHHTNMVRVKAVANALNELNEKVVFVGGATVSLYAERAVFEIRPTDDIDVIIEILNYNERASLEEKLHKIGFSNDIESGIVCRFIIQGIIVDIMPTNDPSIGFTNSWYQKGFENSLDFIIDEYCTIKILTAPYFIATKFEAHNGRGNNDGRTSQDFEDIIFILENRASVWHEINHVNNELKIFLIKEFKKLLNNSYHEEWIEAHVESGSNKTTQFIIENIKKVISK